MPTIPTTATEGSIGEIYRQWLANLGVTPPPDEGLGPLLVALANATIPPPTTGITNAIAQSFPRYVGVNTASSLTGGTLQMSGVWLSAGQVITNINWLSGTTAGATLNHQWGALFTGPATGPLVVASSADATSAAIGANTAITYPIATIAAGASTTYTVPTSGIYYIGIMVQNASGTEPTAIGVTGSAVANGSGTGVTPILSGTSTASLTGVLTFPATAQTTITPTAFTIYTWLT